MLGNGRAGFKPGSDARVMFMKNRYVPATGPAAERAVKLVRFEAEQVCLWSGTRVPLINVVANLRSARDDFTADIRPLKHHQEHVMNMPLGVVQGCPADALRWLVAHEVGHTAIRNKFQERLKVTALGVALVLALLCLATTAAGAVAELSGGSDQWGYLRWLPLVGFLLVLMGISALRRADERRADAFAVAYLGEVRGAEQYFAFTDAAGHGTSSDKLFRTVLWPIRTHPSHSERLRFMSKRLSDQRGFGT